MTIDAPHNEDRLLELLADRALNGLETTEEQELGQLLEANPHVDATEMDLAAAALDLAWLGQAGTLEEMPTDVGQRIFTGLVKANADETRSAATAGPGGARLSLGGFGWLAAAACLSWVLVGNWLRQPTPVQEQLRTLLAVADVVETPFAALDDPTAQGAAGEVIWSTTEQRGFMRLRGLQVNDAATEQYQLWIFDREQDDKFPIDGGVFDVNGTEVLIPIDAKIPVQAPWQFAITVEKPGGVVVSSRARIPMLARVKGD